MLSDVISSRSKGTQRALWLAPLLSAFLLVTFCSNNESSDQDGKRTSSEAQGEQSTNEAQGEQSVTEANAVNWDGSGLWLEGSGKQTTHYCNVKETCPIYYNQGMGPHSFHCTSYRSKYDDSSLDKGAYIALSDEVEGVKVCVDKDQNHVKPGEALKPGSKCWVNDALCGKQVEISCNPEKGDTNCQNKKPIIATVVDFCPKNHPDRRAGQSKPHCGDGETVADISERIQEYFRAKDDNLKLTFKKIGW
jgi:hypothetical protein